MKILDKSTIIDMVTGQIKFVFRNAPEDMVIANLADNYTYVAELPPTSDCYWDFKNKEFILLPTKPSEFHVFDYNQKEWYDQRTITDLKTKKWEEIKLLRSNLEFGGFSWNSYWFDSDKLSQQRLLGAAMADIPVDWTLQNNQVISLSEEEIKEVFKALQQHIATIHERSRIARALLESASTKEEIESISL